MIQVKRMSHVTLETPDLERQIDYFTQVVGLQEAGRENGTAFLATKVGDIVVRVEKGSEARWSGHGLLALTLRPKGYEWRFLATAGGAFRDAGTGRCR